MVDLHFPVLGERLPADHGFELYAALSRLVPELHGKGCRVRIGPVRGSYIGEGMLQLDPRFSRLRLRLPTDAIPLALPLAGTRTTSSLGATPGSGRSANASTTCAGMLSPWPAPGPI
jgi:CRISPR-associated protein Cas6